MIGSSAAPASIYAVELRTANWREMVDWYCKVLSARCLVRASDEGYALLDVGGVKLALLERRPGEPRSSRWSLAIEVDDLTPYLAALETAGTRVAAPTTDAEGIVSVRCCDPDGNRLRLFVWPA
jgi:predicted enzyme related to lactoylglutathione lyase